jgi:hypothetical protein
VVEHLSNECRSWVQTPVPQKKEEEEEEKEEEEEEEDLLNKYW